MTRIYRYIQTHDSGMAPCPDGGQITLATCKPVIRRVARPGDWVIGFRPGSLERGLVLWAGRVESKLSHGEYQRRHTKRSDAVYREGEAGGTSGSPRTIIRRSSKWTVMCASLCFCSTRPRRYISTDSPNFCPPTFSTSPQRGADIG